jgi:putative transposase
MGFWMQMTAKFVVSCFQGRKELALENLALRQQLAVLNRNAKRPKFTESDRLFWVLYSKIADGWQDVLVIGRPRTILDWQKHRFRKFWTRKSRKKGTGRPRTAPEIQKLIRTMSRANPTWGTPRIIGELAKLGIHVCKATVDRYRIRRRGPPSPTWKAFLSNEAKGIAGIDFFTVPTATFRVLYVFIVLRHERRRVVHFNVTENPTASWTAQQIVEAFPWDAAPKYLLRDNDCIYSCQFSNRVQGMNIREVKTAYRSPWQNPYCERLIGSIRRDCLDHVIVLNERHLRTILKSYLKYYHLCRTHLSLEKDCPEPRATDPPNNGKVIAFPKVGGLHHFYARKAA